MKKMLSFSLSLLLFQSSFLILLSSGQTFAQTQEKLDNKAIVELVANGLSDAVIMSMIKTSKTSFDTSVSGVKALNAAGVSDVVILTMVQKSSSANTDAKNTAENSAEANNSNQSDESAGFILPDGTPVKMRIGRNLSSADAKTGETVDFEVLEDVLVNDLIVITRGSVALATVTRAKPKGRMGKGGKLDINIDSVRLASGEKIALRAVKETKGGGSTGAMTGAIVASSILFFPAAPFFLFMKGKDITIPKGTEVTAYVNGDINLNQSKFNRSN